MILADANLLIYAIDRDAPHHRRAHAWLVSIMSDVTPVALAWIVILAFLRITTRTGIMRNPLTPEQAIRYVDSWLAQPHVVIAWPGEKHWPIFRSLLLASGTAGNLTSDAHLAAIAIEKGATIHTADNDFRRFAGIRVFNPIDKQSH
jgi:toxin-antitoxin system PIN domain toxin